MACLQPARTEVTPTPFENVGFVPIRTAHVAQQRHTPRGRIILESFVLPFAEWVENLVCPGELRGTDTFAPAYHGGGRGFKSRRSRKRLSCPFQ